MIYKFESVGKNAVVRKDGAECAGVGRGDKYWTCLFGCPLKRNRGVQFVELELVLQGKNWVSVMETIDGEEKSKSIGKPGWVTVGMGAPTIDLDRRLGAQQKSVSLKSDGQISINDGILDDQDVEPFTVNDKVKLWVDTSATGPLEVVIEVNGKEQCRLPVEEGWCFGVGGHHGMDDSFRLLSSSDPQVRVRLQAPRPQLPRLFHTLDNLPPPPPPATS
jgi:hypothetical protein